MNKTDWFPGTVKPVRDGVYERNIIGTCIGPAVFSKYYLGEWYICYEKVDEASEATFRSSVLRPWRGLAEKPT